MQIDTEQELLSKLEALGPMDDEQRNSVVCSLIGHSRIVQTFFGYVHCGRCNDQIGDAMGGWFDGSKVVIVGHNCDQCRTNYEALTWKDKVFAPDPFAAEEPTPEAGA